MKLYEKRHFSPFVLCVLCVCELGLGCEKRGREGVEGAYILNLNPADHPESGEGEEGGLKSSQATATATATRAKTSKRGFVFLPC